MNKGMTKKQKEENPNHHMGNHTGYELIDGEYHIAPMYQEQFEALGIKAEAIRELLRIVNRHTEDDLVEILKIRQRLWQDISDDIGLDPGLEWIYSGGIIKRKEDKENAT